MPVDPQIIYSQASGLLQTPEGQYVAFGWAGKGIGKKNPAMDNERCVGPLPKGLFRVGEWEETHPGLGPIVARLVQVEGETHGRDGFYFHGPASDPNHYGQESMGCIVVPRAGRLKAREAAPEGSYVQVVA